MPGVARIGDVKWPVRNRSVCRDGRRNIDVAQQITLARQVFLIHRHRKHDGDGISRSTLWCLRTDVHQDKSVRIARDDDDIRIRFFCVNAQRSRQHQHDCADQKCEYSFTSFL